MRRKSFTLLEILVVATIISIIGTVGFSALTTTVKNSRDIKRKSDLEAVKVGLATYHQIKEKYPIDYSFDSILEDENGNVYTSEKFKDPLSANGFVYFSRIIDQAYIICALLENTTGESFEYTTCKSDGTKCNYCATVNGNSLAVNVSPPEDVPLPPPETACAPNCTNKCSGDDGCGGTCPNNCTSGQTCTGGTCVTNIGPCTPDCTGRCGGVSDGCDGTCSNPCVTYAWSVWGNCSSYMAPGTQSRTCIGSDGITYNASFCSGPSTQACSTCPPGFPNRLNSFQDLLCTLFFVAGAMNSVAN